MALGGARRLALGALMAVALAGCAQGPRQAFDLVGAAVLWTVVREHGPAAGGAGGIAE